MSNQVLKMRVTGWSNLRFARIEGNFLGLEIMCMCCACHTCFSRVNAVMNRMQETGYSWRMVDVKIPERDGAHSAVLMIELAEIPEKVDTFLSELLGLEIQMV